MTATKTLLLLLALFCCPFLNAQRFRILLTEIMADPTPVVDLPNAEYLELYNRSPVPIDLAGWKLQTGSSISSAFPAYILQPDSFVVVTARTHASLFPANVLPLSSFPALVNEGTVVSLLSDEGEAVHTVAYKADWYGNVVKKEGGWSLEMIDTGNLCSGSSNWTASTDAAGGTPGRRNSVAGTNKDETPPRLLRAYTTNSRTILLQFDEALDSSLAADRRSYDLKPEVPIATASVTQPEGTEVQLLLQNDLDMAVVYTLTLSSVSDCAGNVPGSKPVVNIGLPQPAAAGDVILNEILFNPKPDAHDYVELYNRSRKIIDVRSLFLAGRTASGLSATLPITNEPYYLFPEHYVILTESKESLERSYHVKQPEAVLELSKLPSLPDDKGSVVLLHQSGIVVDEVAYNKDWHFALISNAEGVALERIDPDGLSQNRNNWASAAATAGYGTPTYKNSQYGQTGNMQAFISITPKAFSPDNDGVDDRAVISYQLTEQGFVANVHIFDVKGRPVRHLAKNETLGNKGQWVWDGLNEQRQALPVGPYVVLIDLFNVKGRRERLKQTVVLARNMR